MSLFLPTTIAVTVLDVKPEMLREMGVKALLLDVDNTLASYISHEPIEGAIDWAHAMTKAGFELVIVSNNYKARVEPFAAKFGLPFITFACKPMPFGYIKAKRMFKLRAKECAIIGDQIFTDIVGANLCGMRSILLEPIDIEKSMSFNVRRKHERKFREHMRKKKGGDNE